jgi:hypothetical protein
MLTVSGKKPRDSRNPHRRPVRTPGMAVLTATKNQWRTKSESRFSSALDGARMPGDRKP